MEGIPLPHWCRVGSTMVAMVGHLGQIRLIVTLRDTWLQIVRFPRVSEGLNPGWIQSTPRPGSRLHARLPGVHASLMLQLYSRYIPLTFLLVLLR